MRWDGQYVAGLSKCSALKKTTEVTSWYEAGDQASAAQIPGKTKYDPITLEAGVTHDRTFENWANKVNNFQGEAAMSLRNFRKDITIEVCNLQGGLISPTTSSAAGCRSTRPCPSWTPTATR